MCDKLSTAADNVSKQLVSRSNVYLSGGAIALLRGGAQFVEKLLERPAVVKTPNSNRLSGPEYASALGLVDLILDCIEHKSDTQKIMPMKVLEGLKGIIGKAK